MLHFVRFALSRLIVFGNGSSQMSIFVVGGVLYKYGNKGLIIVRVGAKTLVREWHRINIRYVALSICIAVVIAVIA